MYASLIQPDSPLRRTAAQATTAWSRVTDERRQAVANLAAVIVAVLIASAVAAVFLGRGLVDLATDAAAFTSQQTDRTAPAAVVDAPWDPYAPALPAGQ